MKLYLFLILVLLLGCKESETITEQSIDTYINQPIKIKKYVFVVFEVEEPKLLYEEPFFDLFTYRKIRDASYDIEWTPRIYCSDIEELEDFNEDTAYQFMDTMEQKIPKGSTTFVTDVISKTNINSDDRNKLIQQGAVRLKKRYYLNFDNYKNASIRRQELLNPTTY